jgi:hypothetical protein
MQELESGSRLGHSTPGLQWRVTAKISPELMHWGQAAVAGAPLVDSQHLMHLVSRIIPDP